VMDVCALEREGITPVFGLTAFCTLGLAGTRLLSIIPVYKIQYNTVISSLNKQPAGQGFLRYGTAGIFMRLICE
ncbi:hypothetical protein J7E73_10290, partial [Paenibacillus albidus]|uniref:hypothetical protein n=1 Tax=Paenibacillus albidus TaxID=2041023 RepID=UPI001BE8F82A